MPQEAIRLPQQPIPERGAYDSQQFLRFATDPIYFRDQLAPTVEIFNQDSQAQKDDWVLAQMQGQARNLLDRGSADLSLSLSSIFAWRNTWAQRIIAPANFRGILYDKTFNDEQQKKWEKFKDEGELPREDAIIATGFLLTSRLSQYIPKKYEPADETSKRTVNHFRTLPSQVANILIPGLSSGERFLFRQPAIEIYKMAAKVV